MKLASLMRNWRFHLLDELDWKAKAKVKLKVLLEP